MTGLLSDKTVAIIGAGTMGAGIAQVAAGFGHQVMLFDQIEGAAQKGIDNISHGLNKLVERGKITDDKKNLLINQIKVVSSIEELTFASLVIEAIVENLEVKQKFFQQLEKFCSTETIFATNTSSLSITAIASALKHSERVVGMHFFNPAPIMKLVEVISGLQTNPKIAQIVFETATNWGKHPVYVRSTPGFIVNRVARPFYAEALRIYQEGAANISTIDAVMRESGGFRMGPFELMDLIGNDVNYSVTASVHNSYYGDQRFTPSIIQQEYNNAGYFGRKAGRGFYNYTDETKNIFPETAADVSTPDTATISGKSQFFNGLLKLLSQTKYIIEDKSETSSPVIFTIKTELATIKLTDGRTATQRAFDEQIDDLILFDLALDYEKATRIAIAKADQATELAIQNAIGFFQRLGKKVSVLDDVAGMCVMRIVCMLINEGADTVNQGVCEMSAIDIAMKNGVNYPEGPIAWGDRIGLELVIKTLKNLQKLYGEDRYRISPLLTRKFIAKKSLL